MSSSDVKESIERAIREELPVTLRGSKYESPASYRFLIEGCEGEIPFNKMCEILGVDASAASNLYEMVAPAADVLEGPSLRLVLVTNLFPFPVVTWVRTYGSGDGEREIIERVKRRELSLAEAKIERVARLALDVKKKLLDVFLPTYGLYVASRESGRAILCFFFDFKSISAYKPPDLRGLNVVEAQSALLQQARSQIHDPSLDLQNLIKILLGEGGFSNPTLVRQEGVWDGPFIEDGGRLFVDFAVEVE